MIPLPFLSRFSLILAIAIPRNSDFEGHKTSSGLSDFGWVYCHDEGGGIGVQNKFEIHRNLSEPIWRLKSASVGSNQPNGHPDISTVQQLKLKGSQSELICFGSSAGTYRKTSRFSSACLKNGPPEVSPLSSESIGSVAPLRRNTSPFQYTMLVPTSFPEFFSSRDTFQLPTTSLEISAAHICNRYTLYSRNGPESSIALREDQSAAP